MRQSPLPLVEPRGSENASKNDLLAFLIGYLQLLAASYDARVRNLARVDVPVACDRLLRLSIGEEVLVWMLYQGHAEHLQVNCQPGEQTNWSSKPSAVLDRGSAFALTP